MAKGLELTSQIIVNILVTSAHYVLVAIGFGLIYRTARFFHFAHAAVYTVSAYTAYVVDHVVGGSVLLGIVAGVAAAAALGGLMEVGIFAPLRRTGASPVVLLVASLGILIILQNAISLVFGDQVRSVGWTAAPEHSMGVAGVRITTFQFTLLGAALGATLLLALLLQITRQGMMLRAVANDQSLAQSFGIDVNRTTLLSFVIGSILAGMAGVLWAHNTALSPLMGFGALLMGVVAAVVGGVGSLPGAFIGAVLISSAQHLAMWQFPSEWQDAVIFLILILFLLVRPQGFFGKPLRMAAV